jgi:hypothetical protein
MEPSCSPLGVDRQAIEKLVAPRYAQSNTLAAWEATSFLVPEGGRRYLCGCGSGVGAAIYLMCPHLLQILWVCPFLGPARTGLGSLRFPPQLPHLAPWLLIMGFSHIKFDFRLSILEPPFCLIGRLPP